MIRLITELGPMQALLLVLELLALLWAFFKAPRWIRTLGRIPVATTLLWEFAGLVRAAGAVVQSGGNIAPTLIWSGIRCMLIALICGLAIWLLSLILLLVRTPRH